MIDPVVCVFCVVFVAASSVITLHPTFHTSHHTLLTRRRPRSFDMDILFGTDCFCVFLVFLVYIVLFDILPYPTHTLPYPW